MFNKKIEQKLDHLITLIEGEEFSKLQKDSEELKQLKELLKSIKFKVKEARIVNDDKGTSVVVTYELPRIIINFDDNHNPIKNDFFFSTNMLNMISLEDMATCQNLIEKAKKSLK